MMVSSPKVKYIKIRRAMPIKEPCLNFGREKILNYKREFVIQNVYKPPITVISSL